MRKQLSILVCLILVASMLAGCSSSPSGGTSGGSQGSTPAPSGGGSTKAPAGSEVAYFAICGPFTGDNAEYGVAFRQSVEIQRELWNAKGGVNGKTIEYKYFDDKSSPEEAANVAQQIVTDPDIICVIGHFQSSCSMAAAPIYQENNMLQVSPTSSHKDYTGIGDWMFRVTQLSIDEARTQAEFLINMLDPAPKKIGLFVINNDWGREMAEVEEEYLHEFAEKAGIKIETFTETVVEGNDDYSSVVTNFVSKGIDVLVNCATYPVAVPFLNQLITASPGIRVISPINNMVPAMVEVLGDRAVGFMNTASFAYFYTDPASVEYVERYREVDPNGKNPIPDGALYFDAAGLVFQAATNCGSLDRADIREELKKIEYDGLTGDLKFDENRNCPRNYGFCIINKDLEWEELIPTPRAK